MPDLDSTDGSRLPLESRAWAAELEGAPARVLPETNSRFHHAPKWRQALEHSALGLEAHAWVEFFLGNGLQPAWRLAIQYEGPDHYGEKELWLKFP
jgi:hypothetical protein